MEGLKLKEADFVMGLETENSLEWPEYLHFSFILFSTASVSYTHLRAHETDSYLVCRLLLEKKVRIQSHSSYHKHLIESFETINSVKTGFHHLRSFSVPPVNLKMESKLLQ